MKVSEIKFIGEVIRQLKGVEARGLTVEYVASLFSDRLSYRYKNFSRQQFIEATGVSKRMVEEVEATNAPPPTVEEVLGLKSKELLVAA